MSNFSLSDWMNIVARPWDNDSMSLADQMELLVPGLPNNNDTITVNEFPNHCNEDSKQISATNFTKSLKKVKVESSVTNQPCAICLEEFSVGSEARCVASCSHMYHKHCIIGWLKKNNSCPLCRCKTTP